MDKVLPNAAMVSTASSSCCLRAKSAPGRLRRSRASFSSSHLVTTDVASASQLSGAQHMDWEVRQRDCLLQHRRPAYVEADVGVTPLSAALADSDFDASLPAVFTCEGLFYYLPPTAVDAMLADLGSAAPGVQHRFNACRLWIGSALQGSSGGRCVYLCGLLPMGAPNSRAEPLRPDGCITKEAASARLAELTSIT